jgi:hypothetical protein
MCEHIRFWNEACIATVCPYSQLDMWMDSFLILGNKIYSCRTLWQNRTKKKLLENLPKAHWNKHFLKILNSIFLKISFLIFVFLEIYEVIGSFEKNFEIWKTNQQTPGTVRDLVSATPILSEHLSERDRVPGLAVTGCGHTLKYLKIFWS